jgi:Ca-activated chloride channel homolog
MKKFAFLCLLLGGISFTNAQIINAFEGRKTRILFLLDASGSMLAEMEHANRWAVAVTLLSNLADSLRQVPDVEIGLRVFGHNKPNAFRDCNDTKLEVPFSAFNHKEFRTKIRSIKPLGFTSITQSLLATENDFPADKTARNVIIIITDGVEECPGDPCEVSALLQKKGIILRPFIVGMGTDAESFRKNYACAGTYHNAEGIDQFDKIIGVIIKQVLNNTSVQVNLLDDQNRPTETDVPMSLIDADNGTLVEHVVHTMNGKGIPDTLYLDPLRRYDVLVHTLPPVLKKNFEVIPGKHNTFAVETPRGDLHLKIGGITNYRELHAIVRKSGTMETVHHQPFNTKQKYITGSYDIEILTTPRLKFKNLIISQNKTKIVEIPSPGMLSMKTGRDLSGSIFQEVEGKMEWVKDIPTEAGRHEIIMQPGNYVAVYRLKSETRTLYTKKLPFTISSGVNTTIAL